MQNALLEGFQKQAKRAPRKGDYRQADAIELEYIKRNVSLYSRRADASVPAQCIRLMRGAGDRGQSLLEWALPDGTNVVSDMDAQLLDEFEDLACALLLRMSIVNPLQLELA